MSLAINDLAQGEASADYQIVVLNNWDLESIPGGS